MGFLDKVFGRKPPHENQELCDAMTAVSKADNRATRIRLYNGFLRAPRLWFPVVEVPAEMRQHAGGVTTSNTPVSLPMIKGKDGMDLLPVFTDEEALKNWDPNTPYLGAAPVAYFQLAMSTPANALIINPFDPIRKMLRPGGLMLRHEFLSLAKGTFPIAVEHGGVTMQFPPGQSVLVGQPANPPRNEILASLAAAAAQLPQVRALYLVQLSTGQHTGPAIGVDADIPKEQEGPIFERLGGSITALLAKGEGLDFLVTRGGLGDTIRKNGKQIYSRR